MPKIITSKEEILEKVVPVFLQYGYNNASIAMLAEACGLQKAHIYYYFASKEALMVAVLESVLLRAELLLFLPAMDSSINKSIRLQSFLTAFEDFFSNQNLGNILVNTILQTIGMDTPFKEIAQKFYQKLIDSIAHLYEERYSPSYAINKAEQAVQDLQGSIMMSQIFNEPSFFKSALKRVGKKV